MYGAIEMAVFDGSSTPFTSHRTLPFVASTAIMWPSIVPMMIFPSTSATPRFVITPTLCET